MALIDRTLHGRPSTTRYVDHVSTKSPNYDTDESDYDIALATASPVGKAVLSHSLAEVDARKGGGDGIDRHGATWKTIDETILRQCLDKTAVLRNRRLE